MSNIQPPITQHLPIFRHLAYIGGQPLLYGAIGFYAITGRKRGPRTRALIAWKNKVLLVRNVADHNRWTLPGGGPKPGESYVDSLAREIQEELNIRLPPGKLHLIKHYDKSEVGEPYDKVCFYLDFSDTQLSEITLSNEILEAQWFSTSKLPGRLSPVVRLALDDHHRQGSVDWTPEALQLYD